MPGLADAIWSCRRVFYVAVLLLMVWSGVIKRTAIDQAVVVVDTVLTTLRDMRILELESTREGRRSSSEYIFMPDSPSWFPTTS
jgi:hypothetical protein